MGKLTVFSGFEKVFNVIKEHMECDGPGWHIAGIVDKPKGARQVSECPLFNHEYVDQRVGCCGDDFSGSMYFPLGDKYVQVEYYC